MTIDLDIMRAHEADTLCVACICMVRGIQCNAAGIQHALMHAAVKQVHVAEKTVHE